MRRASSRSNKRCMTHVALLICGTCQRVNSTDHLNPIYCTVTNTTLLLQQICPSKLYLCRQEILKIIYDRPPIQKFSFYLYISQIVKAWFRSQGSLYGIYGDQSGTGIRSSLEKKNTTSLEALLQHQSRQVNKSMTPAEKQNRDSILPIHKYSEYHSWDLRRTDRPSGLVQGVTAGVLEKTAVSYQTPLEPTSS